MWRVVVSIMAIFLLAEVKASTDISLEDLLERLVTLEDWKRDTEREVSTLRETVEQQSVVIRNLEKQLSIQANITATVQSCKQDKTQYPQEQKVKTVDETKRDGQISNNKIRDTNHHNQIPAHTSTVRKRLISGGVAFTAYLDHNVDIGNKQTLKFNQLIINDGNGYNIHTGVFTCPEAGVYIFSFVVGQKAAYDFSGELVVNDQHVVGAVVDVIHIGQDLQGGNTAVVRLNLGDSVWVETLFSMHHVEGSTNFRLTTFTGFLLYI